MSRKLRDADYAISETGRPGPTDWEGCRDDTPKAARETSPYKPGDVVPFLDDGAVKWALILRVQAEFLGRAYYWIPKYRVRVQRKDGQFAKCWRTIYPGYIERGFNALQETI